MNKNKIITGGRRGEMGGEGCGRPCEEIEEDKRSYRGSGAGSVLSWTAQQVCHHPKELGW